MTATLGPADAVGPVRRLWLAAARRVGCTEGQVQTVAIGLAVGLLAAATGLPPVFEDRPLADAFAAPAVEPGPSDRPADSPAPETGAGPPVPVGGRPSDGSNSAASSDPGSTPSPEAPPATEPPHSSAPVLGVPGANGACAVVTRSIANPRHPEGAPASAVWIYEPAGSADGSITGGRCDDDSRPVVFIAHGFGQSDPVGYVALIEHLVSVGNVVVYPSYEFADGDRQTLEESYRVVDAGIVAAVEQSPRIDTSRVGWWGHSHGGGMVPYLVQQGAGRGWGEQGLWMSIVAQAYTQLVGDGDIPVPADAEAMTVAFQHDALADARLGIDVFESLILPDAQKRHVTVESGAHDGAPFVAEHGAPEGVAGGSDAVDVLLWRYADLLQTCALHGVGCDADLTSLPAADGTLARHAVVRSDPVDVGPYPAILAECDAIYGPTLNPRIRRCGPTRL